MGDDRNGSVHSRTTEVDTRELLTGRQKFSRTGEGELWQVTRIIGGCSL